MTHPEEKRHFTQIDSTFGSAFRSRFPVDLSHPAIRQIVQKNLPTTFDTVFLTKGCGEQFSTITKAGAIPLMPVMARERARHLSPEEASKYDSKDFICRSLTDGHDLSVAYASYDRSRGFISDFSLVVDARASSKEPLFYELRGSLGDEYDEERVFEIACFSDKEQLGDSIALDEEMVTDFVAAINMQRGGEVYVGTLEGMLTDIMESSPAIQHIQQGEYDTVDGEELFVTISREETITRGVAKLALYMITMEEKSPMNIATNARTTRTFSLSYIKDRSPRYIAELESFIYDPDGNIDKITRANQYEALSQELRAKPALVYEALDQTIAKLGELS